jgi:hypothetical protein
VEGVGSVAEEIEVMLVRSRFDLFNIFVRTIFCGSFDGIEEMREGFADLRTFSGGGCPELAEVGGIEGFEGVTEEFGLLEIEQEAVRLVVSVLLQ